MIEYDANFSVEFPAEILRDAPDGVALDAMANLPVLLRTHAIRGR